MDDAVARFRRIVEDEAHTRVGDLVVVRWTSVYRSFACLARVTQTSGRTICAELECATGSYVAGHEVVAPRIADFRKWSFSNCALKPDTARMLGWRPTSEELAVLTAERGRQSE
jgi:hypothetical protein